MPISNLPHLIRLASMHHEIWKLPSWEASIFHSSVADACTWQPITSTLETKRLQEEAFLEVRSSCAAVAGIKSLLHEKRARVVKALALTLKDLQHLWALECGVDTITTQVRGAADLFSHHFYLLVLQSGDLLPNVTVFFLGEWHNLIRQGESGMFCCLPDEPLG